MFQVWEPMYILKYRKVEKKNFRSVSRILPIIVSEILLKKKQFLQSRKTH